MPGLAAVAWRFPAALWRHLHPKKRPSIRPPCARWGLFHYVLKKSLHKPNILGLDSGYNAHRRAGKSAYLVPKRQKNRRSCQFTIGNQGKRLISNLYVCRGVTRNAESGLSYCPDNNFFLKSLDESGLFPYSVKKWDAVVNRGFQGSRRGRFCSEVVAASIWMRRGAWRSRPATGLISSNVVRVAWF